MSVGFEALDAMIARLQGLRSFAAEAASRAAPHVEAAARATAAAGTTPVGAAWAPKKRPDGRRPLEGAAAFVHARAAGTVLVLAIQGHHLYHSLGIGRPKRQIIPDKGEPIPPSIRAACERGAREAFARAVGGR